MLVVALLAALCAPIAFFLLKRLPPAHDSSAARFKGLTIGHRGTNHPSLAENTIDALLYALEHGAQGVEFDVLTTKDNVSVVFHDTNTMRRVCKLRNPELHNDSLLDKSVHQLTYDTIVNQFCYSKGSKDARVNTVEEVVVAVLERHRDAKLFIELKDFSKVNEAVNTLCSLIQRYNLFEQVLVTSFNPFALYKIRMLDPRICTHLLVCNYLINVWLNGTDGDLTEKKKLETQKEIQNVPTFVNYLRQNALLLWLFRRLLVLVDYLFMKSGLTWLPLFLGLSAIGIHENVVWDGFASIKSLQNRGYAVNVWVVNETKRVNKLHDMAENVTITTDTLFPKSTTDILLSK